MFGKIKFENKHSLIRKLFGFVVCANLVFSSVAAAPLTNQPQGENPPAATPAPEIQPTDIPADAVPAVETTQAPAPVTIDATRVNFRQIVVKFKEQTDQVSAMAVGENPLLGLVPDAVVEPMFQNAAVSAMAEGIQEAPVSDIQVPGQYYFLQLPEGKTSEEAAAALAEILMMDGVEEAYMEPVYSQATTDHSGDQTYLDDNDGTSAVNGIQASTTNSTWDQTGGYGANVRVTVVDYGWDTNHQDIALSASYGSNNDTTSLKDHGTAVLGILGGKGTGIKGIVPEAQLQVYGPSFSGTPISLAQAIYTAAIHSRAGDVIVIPLQAMDAVDRGFTCPTGCDCVQGSLPVEYTTAVYDVIKSATANGIIVVEAAGNGAADLDTEDALSNRIYGTKFMRGTYDSGAIMVGAGDSKTDAGATPAMVVRAPSCFSNYGERLDLQGWGDGIVTTGYGDLEGTDRTDSYTAIFGGTSGASAIVAGSVASLQGVARARGYVIKAKDMRTFLVDTGTEQHTPVVNKVGPLPDLLAALEEKLKDEITLLTPPAAYDPPIDTLRPTLDWTDFPGASAYGVIVAKGSSFNNVVASSSSLSISQYTIASNLEPNTEYYWKARVLVGGSWRDYTAAWNFKTPDISSIPLIPTLYSPSNSSSTADLTPTFTWKAPSTKPETGYNVQVTTEMSYDAATIHAIGDPSTLTYTPGVDLDGDTIYYWRVQSVGTVACADCTSAWTGWRSLKTAPDSPGGLAVDTTPAAGDAIGSLRPVVSWDAVDYARAYKIKYSNGIKTYTVTVGIPKGAYSPSTHYTFSKKLNGGLDYTWYVAVLGRYAWSEYSSSVTTTLYTPPATPTLSVPKNNGLYTSSGFTWKQPSGAAATGYYIQASTSSKFEADNPPYVYTYTNDTGSSALTLTPADGTFNIDQKYYWRLKSYNLGGAVKQYSEWSKTYAMKTTPPEPTTLISPADTADVDTLRPIFTWSDVTSARGYSVKYSYSPTGSAFKTVTASVNLSAVAGVFKYELNTDLPPNRTIYWKVASKGLYGLSNYTAPISFNTYYPPNVPTITSPGNGTVLGTFYQKLNWSDATDSTKDGTNDTPITYDLQIDKSSSFNSDGGSPIFELTSLTSSEYTITKPDLDTYLVDAGKYYWRVRSQNSTGMYSRWTSAYSYTTPTLIRGTVFDATSAAGLLSTRGVGGTDVCVDGTGSCVSTDVNGDYEIRGLAAGSTLTLKVALAGYINSYRKVTLTTGSTSDVNFGIVEQPADGIVRIVVNWDSSPSELEAHLLLPTSGTSVVKDIYCKTDTASPNECDASYIGSLAADPEAALLESYNMPTVSLPTPSPRLTRNPTHGYGPVVFDIDQADAAAGYYRLAILQKTPAISTNLISISNANVQIYFGTSNITPSNVIWAPTIGTGLWWKVFDLYSSALPSVTTITKYNTYTSTKPENPQ